MADTQTVDQGWVDAPESAGWVDAPATPARIPTVPEQIKTSLRNQAKGIMDTLSSIVDPVKGLALGNAMLDAQRDQWDKAKAAYASGDHLSALEHGLGAVVPFLGPAIENTADKLATPGSRAEGLTDIVAPLALAGVRAAPAIARSVPAVARAVPVFARGAAQAAMENPVSTLAKTTMTGAAGSAIGHIVGGTEGAEVGGLVGGSIPAAVNAYRGGMAALRPEQEPVDFPNRGLVGKQLRKYTPSGGQQFGSPPLRRSVASVASLQEPPPMSSPEGPTSTPPSPEPTVSPEQPAIPPGLTQDDLDTAVGIRDARAAKSMKFSDIMTDVKPEDAPLLLQENNPDVELAWRRYTDQANSMIPKGSRSPFRVPSKQSRSMIVNSIVKRAQAAQEPPPVSPPEQP